MKHLNITVKGIVQGVFFRKFTQLKAEELGIRGYVKNLRDGSVYIEAEGEDHALNQFIAWCHEGPPAAEVGHVQVEEGTPGNFGGFSIMR